ncbi:MAG TPA: hypothetical protein GXX19_09700 [Syntrophomonadaceae bacterium]|nr:hypothetical protein [Syntrophomonadaceae bacterium]
MPGGSRPEKEAEGRVNRAWRRMPDAAILQERCPGGPGDCRQLFRGYLPGAVEATRREKARPLGDRAETTDFPPQPLHPSTAPGKGRSPAWP